MNSPGTPGHSSRGRKAASVVAVEDTTGQNINFAARGNASDAGMPSEILRFAYSVTTIAPSTNMPTHSTIPNMTIMLTVNPAADRIKKPIMNEVGIAMPTNNPDPTPSDATTMIITSAMAVRIED